MNWLDDPGLPPPSLQLASDGAWERALPVGQVGRDRLYQWLGDAGANVAIESVYLRPDGHLRGFVGFRHQIADAARRRTFWCDVIDATDAFAHRTPREQLTAWLELLGQPALLGTPPDGIQMGVFNQWLSAGPVTLAGDRLTAHELATGPAWLRDGATAPICREAFWTAPERVWIAQAVSVPSGARHGLPASERPA